MGFLIFLCILLAVVMLYVWYFVAKEFENIAAEKGYAESKYFWYTFFLGIAGMLMVIALPKKEPAAVFYPQKPKEKTNSATTPENHTHLWRCMNCGNMIEQFPCKHCGYEGQSGSNQMFDTYWICSKCKTKNLANRHICWSCEQPFEN